MQSKQRITVLGATGSIGLSTLDVLRRHPEQYQVVALTANSRVDELARLCAEFAPRYAVMPDPARVEQLKRTLADLGCATEVLCGEQALVDVATLDDVDSVMAAIVGAAGLLPTLAAVKAGKRVLLANKEALVMSGQLFMDAVAESGATLLPIDSEHNAMFQCLPLETQQDTQHTTHTLNSSGISRLLLTGSGGPVRTLPIEQLDAVTPEQAVAHPNWSMGQKISVDSATMMNKGLEFIEARWLFNARPDQIQVVIHPQSVIHSMVQYTDGSVLAQLGNPDMRTPIAHALAWPARIDSGVQPLDFYQLADFSFEAPDFDRFPCLKLAIDCCHAGQGASTVLNAANEIAVDAFLQRRIRFTDIARVCQQALEQTPQQAQQYSELNTLEGILELDRLARLRATDAVTALASRVKAVS